MRADVRSSVLAGLVAGIVFGGIMQVMTAPTPEGGAVPMMAMVAMVVRSDVIAIGWLYHLFNSAVIGAIFGGLVAPRVSGYWASLVAGALYGAAWWILGGVILMPVLLGMPAFAPLLMAPMVPVALGSLVGHLVYGLILGGGAIWLAERQALKPAAA